MTGAHAFLAPSSAGRWGPGGCPASARLEALYPEDEESPEAREGTAAHFYLSEALSGRTVGIGAPAPNGHLIDRDMVEAARELLADIRSTQELNPGALRVEERVSMNDWVSPQNWGTPDAYLLNFERRRLYLWDYKYGHRYVDVWKCWQLLDYAAGILESNGVPWSEIPLWTIVTTIAQPRSYHPNGTLREWNYTGGELVGFIGELRTAAVAALNPEAPMVTGSHCRDCNARLACPALQSAAMAAVDLSMTGQPVNLPPTALGLELVIIEAALDRLKARATGLQEEALRLIRTGTDVAHWKADYSQGRERWTLTPAEVIALGKNFGVNLAAPQAALTPAQSRKAGIDGDLVKGLSEHPKGNLALVRFDTGDVARYFK